MPDHDDSSPMDNKVQETKIRLVIEKARAGHLLLKEDIQTLTDAAQAYLDQRGQERKARRKASDPRRTKPL